MDKVLSVWIPIAASICAAIMPFVAMSADTNVSGTWAVTIKSQIRSRETTMKLNQQGKDLSGYVVDTSGSQVPLTGTITGSEIKISYPLTGLTVQLGSGDSKSSTVAMLNYVGTVNGATLTAKASAPQLGEIQLSGKKQ